MSLAYHRMFRARPGFLWWKPLVAVVLAVAFTFAFQIIWSNLVVLVVSASQGKAAASALVDAAAANPQDSSNPLVMLYTLGALATLVPAVVLAVRVAGLGGIGQLASVAGRFRWRWLARCLVPGAIFIGVTLGLNVVASALWPSAESDAGTATPPAALVVSILLIVLLVPLQATGEELAFRGLGLQTAGSWIRQPAAAVVATSVVFAFAHSYNVWGKLDVGALGAAFAFLTWRTGGLEAAVVGHVINNVVVFIIAAPVVQTAQSDGSPAGAAITVVASAVYVGLVEWQFRRSRLSRVAPEPVENAGGATGVPRRLAG